MIKKTTTKNNKKTAVKSVAGKVSKAATAQKSTEPVASQGVPLEVVQPHATKVFVAGSFNNWTPEATPLSSLGNGRWVGNLKVSPGRYEYLFVVDGQWMPDPHARETAANPFGGHNSVLIVSE